MRSKISIIGAGNVGTSCAQRIAEKSYADVVLLDIVEGLPQGKALDILQSAPLLNFDCHITGTNNYEDTKNSDLVIITSGMARKSGMTRDQLLLANMRILTASVEGVINFSPNCVIIVVTNPVDAMTYLALHLSGFSRNRILGLSGVLDGARFASFIAAELNISVEDICACVMGEHEQEMLVAPRLTTVKGIPLTKMLPAETINKLVEHTVKGAAGLEQSHDFGTAFYAPSAAVACMAEAIVLDKKRIMPCAAYLNGEYGITDVVVGVPVKLGKSGAEQVIEFELTVEEKVALTNSVKSIRKQIDVMELG